MTSSAMKPPRSTDENEHAEAHPHAAGPHVGGVPINVTSTTETFTTGEMARLSNNTLRTVRFYEEAGILQPLGRTVGGHRVFDRAQLDRLRFVSDMREAGMSLEQIRNLLELKHQARSGDDAAAKAISTLRERIDELRTKIEALGRLHDDLERTVDAAASCLACENGTLFPNQCSGCGRLLARRPISRGMRVLWGIDEGGSSQAAGEEENGTEAPPAGSSE